MLEVVVDRALPIQPMFIRIPLQVLPEEVVVGDWRAVLRIVVLPEPQIPEEVAVGSG
jgi:hypothetical protein